ncbi:MAG: PorV/PorQ family protein [Rhodothermales bacterium]|nr:PorV/PorQ family protein [Rhodothermales bacterium]
MALLLGSAQQGVAQDVRTGSNVNRLGTAAGMWLLVPTTAQTASFAMSGTAGTNSMSGLDAASQNPANLMLNMGTNAMFSRLNYVADIGVNTFGVAQRFGRSNVSLSVSSWDLGDEVLRTESEPDGGEVTWSASNMVAGLGFARQFTDRISAGVTAKVATEALGDDLHGSSVLADAGINYVIPGQGLRFGVAVRNIGTAMRYGGDGLAFDGIGPDGKAITGTVDAEQYELPASLDFGVSYQRPFSPDVSMTLSTNFRSVQYANDQVAGAVAINFRNLFYVNGGYRYEPNTEDAFITGANVGAGLNVPFGRSNVKLDYTYSFTRVLNRMQFITASVTF